ncbi:GNAT family N-acetyltransferase [Simiduia agarivorans]|uniref:GCN5-related N-acetyltransferase n=1 Tax=Simiduia agarivorans (strain DSM 21679 / JCM 13881 / BCRC 17597 / SA1) TaxID=1117647 RepID=K4KJN9_SIMAS|nr:GNAT family N-acetyltransferase [Simiduia agarivorans]AFU99369.1 GCN5-related N-acetyltransferase [Simiduia agarivorans SA1 = DSM 21679]
MISFSPIIDLAASAKLTSVNMREYYERYGVAWDVAAIESQTADLDNFDLIADGVAVGAVRLSYESDCCYLRDLQVAEGYKNRGYGAAAIAKCVQLALSKGARVLKLKVFQISPAYRLYERSGFVVESSDDRFYYMSRVL